MNNKKGLRTALKEVIRSNKLLSIGLSAALAVSVILSLLPPLVLEQIVNQLGAKKAVEIKWAVMYFVFFAASGIFDSVKEVMITVFGQKTTHRLRKNMCMKLSRLPVAFFTAHKSGALVSRFVNDVDTVDSLFTSGIISMFADACKVVSILIVIFVKSAGLGIIMVIVLPLIFMLTRHFQKRMLSAQLDDRRAISKINNHIPETIQNIRMIHNFAKEKYMRNRYDRYIDESYAAQSKSNFYDSVYSPIIICISTVIIGVMMLLAAQSGEMRSFFGMSVGTAVAVIAYVGKIFDPLESIGMEIQSIQSAAAGVKRINEFLGSEERQKGTQEVALKDIAASKNAIEFNNVSFSYDGIENVINNFSFKVKNGEKVVLRGRTGAGKSTIFKLLLGLYVPVQGSIKIFGIDADKIDDMKKRNLFGLVEQNFNAVPGTIKDQISMFDESVGMDKIRNAAVISGIDDYIMSLKNNYNTEFNENLFSKGQLQLLAIARAVVCEPKVLVLDEITANLDSSTEKNVLDALNRAAKDRTVFSVSHRKYTENERVIQVGQ
jgi:ABC-type multidrug transport system fused ATPase/permease subunit